MCVALICVGFECVTNFVLLNSAAQENMEDDKLAAYAEQLEAKASKGRKGLGRGAELRVEGMREMLQKEKEEAFAQMSPREQDKCVVAALQRVFVFVFQFCFCRCCLFAVSFLPLTADATDSSGTACTVASSLLAGGATRRSSSIPTVRSSPKAPRTRKRRKLRQPLGSFHSSKARRRSQSASSTRK